MIKHKIGLKLWSSNIEYLEPAIRYFNNNVFNYIELFTVPNSSGRFLKKWEKTKIPYLLHAPHSYSGFNLSLREFENDNCKTLEEIELYRRALKPKYIIFHPGIGGTVDETIRQLKLFSQEYPNIFSIALLENKPKIGLKNEICIGACDEELRHLIDETGIRFCLDIGHAIYSAAWHGRHWDEFIEKLMALDPKVYHLSDGYLESKKDCHLNFGKGDFDIMHLIRKMPNGSFVTIETDKKSANRLSDFEEDIRYYTKCLKRLNSK